MLPQAKSLLTSPPDLTPMAARRVFAQSIRAVGTSNSLYSRTERVAVEKKALSRTELTKPFRSRPQNEDPRLTESLPSFINLDII